MPSAPLVQVRSAQRAGAELLDDPGGAEVAQASVAAGQGDPGLLLIAHHTVHRAAPIYDQKRERERDPTYKTDIRECLVGIQHKHSLTTVDFTYYILVNVHNTEIRWHFAGRTLFL